MNIMMHAKRQANLYDLLEKVRVENALADMKLDHEMRSLRDKLNAIFTRPFSLR